MNLINVDSSNIDAVGFTLNNTEVANEVRRGTLSVIFKSNRRYDYADVPESAYKNFISSPSKGKYFNVFIKNRYKIKGG